MDDLIYKEAVLDMLDDISTEVEEGYGFQYNKWREHVLGMPSAEPERKKWNPCSERLPDKPGSYICTCSDGTPYPKVTVIKLHPRTKAWELTGTRAYWKVRAWMPLPECYRGEEE